MSGGMSFSSALARARHAGASIARTGWNGPGQHVVCQCLDAGSKMTAPYLYLKNAQGGLVPWVPSQGDLFADDWIEV